MPDGSTSLRIVHRRYPTALYFGKGAEARWNDPVGDDGVLYLADALETAFAETFGHDVPQRRPPASDKLIATRELEERDLFGIVYMRPLGLGLLHGAGLAALNLDVGLLASMHYRVPQIWSRWIYVEGLLASRKPRAGGVPGHSCSAIDGCPFSISY